MKEIIAAIAVAAVFAAAAVFILLGGGENPAVYVEVKPASESEVQDFFQQAGMLESLDSNIVRSGRSDGSTGVLIYKDYNGSSQKYCDIFYAYYQSLIDKGFETSTEINGSVSEFDYNLVNQCSYSCGLYDEKEGITYLFESYAEINGTNARAAWTGYK